MQEGGLSPLAVWQNFYVIIGAAAAATAAIQTVRMIRRIAALLLVEVARDLRTGASRRRQPSIRDAA